jgi:hypothetical protein
MLRDLCKRRQAAFITLNRDDLFGAFAQQSAGEAAGAGANLNDGHIFKRTSRARDLAGEIEIEKEVLPERFLCREIKITHDIAQGRKAVALTHAL